MTPCSLYRLFKALPLLRHSCACHRKPAATRLRRDRLDDGHIRERVLSPRRGAVAGVRLKAGMTKKRERVATHSSPKLTKARGRFEGSIQRYQYVDSEFIPTLRARAILHAFCFGYTGPHCRRDRACDRMGRPDAGDPCGAAQKMVFLSPERWRGVRVSHTNRLDLITNNSESPQKDRSCAEKPPNGARRAPL